MRVQELEREKAKRRNEMRMEYSNPKMFGSSDHCVAAERSEVKNCSVRLVSCLPGGTLLSG